MLSQLMAIFAYACGLLEFRITLSRCFQSFRSETQKYYWVI
jgi:hypothetical protein